MNPIFSSGLHYEHGDGGGEHDRRGEPADDEQRRGEDAVEHRSQKQCAHRVNADEIDYHADERAEDKDGVKAFGVMRLFIQAMLSPERFADDPQGEEKERIDMLSQGEPARSENRAIHPLPPLVARSLPS
jgi:hypothetical protein